MVDGIRKAWREAGTKAAARGAKAIGLRVTATQLDQLVEATRRANQTRTARILEPVSVVDAIERALADPHGIGIVHGGEANQGEQRSTLCLAFRDGATITVGVGLSRARGAGPGVTWKELQPWSRADPPKNLVKLRAWARRAAGDRVSFPIAAKLSVQTRGSAPAADREATLLDGVLAHPDDDAARAVYADALLERGEPYGEYISIELALASSDAGPGEQAALRARSKALVKQHAATWCHAIAQFTLKQLWHRGFVRAVELRAQAFLAEGARLFTLAPIESVRLRGLTASSVRQVAGSPALARVRELRLHGRIGDAGARSLATSSFLKGLRGLDVDGCGMSAKGIEVLLDASPSLEWIAVGLLEQSRAAVIAARPRIIVRAHSVASRGSAVAVLAQTNRIERVERPRR